jgi:hypothetical protein
MPSRWRLAHFGVASLSFDRVHSCLQITSRLEARQTTSEAVRAAMGVIRGTTRPVAMKSTGREWFLTAEGVSGFAKNCPCATFDGPLM